MICEKCHSNEGTPYTFFYGTKQSSQRIQGDQVITRTLTKGSGSQHAQVPLCQKCITKYEAKVQKKSLWWLVAVGWALLMGWAFISGGWGLITELKTFQGWVTMIVVVVLVLSVLAYGLNATVSSIRYLRLSQGEREKFCLKQEIGERFAIKLRKKDLKKQGYNTYWTPTEYAKFKATATQLPY